MSPCAKFQHDSFVRRIVSSKNAKRMFLSSEPPPDNFSKVLFYSDMVSNLCVQFHDRRMNSLGGVESQRNQ